jgi:hypothetical protein
MEVSLILINCREEPSQTPQFITFLHQELAQRVSHLIDPRAFGPRLLKAPQLFHLHQ